MLSSFTAKLHIIEVKSFVFVQKEILQDIQERFVGRDKPEEVMSSI